MLIQNIHIFFVTSGNVGEGRHLMFICTLFDYKLEARGPMHPFPPSSETVHEEMISDSGDFKAHVYSRYKFRVKQFVCKAYTLT